MLGLIRKVWDLCGVKVEISKKLLLFQSRKAWLLSFPLFSSFYLSEERQKLNTREPGLMLLCWADSACPPPEFCDGRNRPQNNVYVGCRHIPCYMAYALPEFSLSETFIQCCIKTCCPIFLIFLGTEKCYQASAFWWCPVKLLGVIIGIFFSMGELQSNECYS